MPSNTQKTIFGLLLVASFYSSLASTEETPAHECEKETTPLMTLKSHWMEMYQAAAILPKHCFDGYFAEGISDTIAKKMGQDWSGFLKVLSDHSEDDQFF